MTVPLCTLDDGAWVSVNNSRVVGAGDLWPLADHDLCDCETADFLVEAFAEVGADGRHVETRATGRCIACGTEGVTDWLRVGSVREGVLRPVAFGSVRVD